MIKKREIYLDYNASSPLLPNVKEAMADIMGPPSNASSVHSFGRRAKDITDTARKRLSNLIGASSEHHIIFTSSGTEANNTALKGFPGYKLITTVVEHPSVLNVVGAGAIPVDSNGVVKLDVLELLLTQDKGPVLVSVQFANNETGVIQPIKEIAEIVHKNKAVLHVDAVQAFGRVPFDIISYDIDLVTISSHKLGGPIGAAALIFKKSLPLKPLMIGGGQELRFRPGTPNVVAIHGFGIAAEIALSTIASFADIALLRDNLETKLQQFDRNVIIFGKKAKRLPNTSLINMPGVSNETQVIHFDINGIAISAGSACSSGRIDLPYVAMAMGHTEKEARTAIRVSLGLDNTQDEIDAFISLWKELHNKSDNLYKNVA